MKKMSPMIFITALFDLKMEHLPFPSAKLVQFLSQPR
jgi:hypothetical protein